MFFYVCLSVRARKACLFAVVLLLFFFSFRGVSKKKRRNPKIETHDKKKFKRGKDRKKKRENTRAHTRKIYIYARTHGYIYIYRVNYIALAQA